MTLESFFAYFFILFIATISPGPSMLLAMNHGVSHGIGYSVFSGIGNVAGNLLMAVVSIAGLGVVLVTSGMIFNVITWLGIFYLVFLGLKMIFGPVKAAVPNTPRGGAGWTGGRRSKLFLDGFIIAIGNPKGILFFVALFPQFINVQHASAAGFLIVFLTLAGVAFGCYMLYAVFGEKLSRLFRLQSFRKVFNRITGSLFIGMGLTMAFSKK
jgi:homoserine/homoserine lactone efflux protein